MSDSRAPTAVGLILVLAGLLLLAGAFTLEQAHHRAGRSAAPAPKLAERPATAPTAPEPIAAEPIAAEPIAPEPPDRFEAVLDARPVELPLTMTAGGKLEWLADDGAAVAAGDPVARLAGADRIRQRIGALERRREHYQKKADAANAHQAEAAAAGDTEALRRYGALYFRARDKVEEKQRGIDDNRTRLQALELVAPAAGRFTRAVAPGERVAEGDRVGILERTELAATFAVEDAAARFTDGQEIRLEHQSEEISALCTVTEHSDQQVTVSCPDGQLAAGAPVWMSIEAP